LASGSEVLKGSKAEGVKYDSRVQEAKANGEEADVGPPHSHLCVAGLTAGCQAALEKGIDNESDKELVEALRDDLGTVSQEDVLATVTYWTTKEIIKGPNGQEGKKLATVTVAIDSLTEATTFTKMASAGLDLAFKLRKAITIVFKMQGGHRKHGPAPRGELERVMQSQLKAVQGRAKPS